MPIAPKLIVGQEHDGNVLVADRAYDSDALRNWDGGAGRMGQHQARAELQASTDLQHLPLSIL